jgi:hypothetical protein
LASRCAGEVVLQAASIPVAIPISTMRCRSNDARVKGRAPTILFTNGIAFSRCHERLSHRFARTNQQPWISKRTMLATTIVQRQSRIPRRARAAVTPKAPRATSHLREAQLSGCHIAQTVSRIDSPHTERPANACVPALRVLGRDLGHLPSRAAHRVHD